MDLHLYPLDVQECPLIIESCKLQFIVGSLSTRKTTRAVKMLLKMDLPPFKHYCVSLDLLNSSTNVGDFSWSH